ncbi:MAG: DUF1467 family protein [Alphaproteobacteria bacterium]|nr:DUF1467 family protein [Alphaproteobacteria bacterium]
MRDVVLSGSFVVLWFLSFFVLLPIGLSGETNDHGAPVKPRLLLKAIIATAVSLVLWGIFYGMVRAGYVEL